MDLERNDMSLINHFFVQDLQPPRLCALDLPGGHLNGGLFGPDSSFLPRFPDELEVGAWRPSGPPCPPWHRWHAAKGVMTKLSQPGHNRLVHSQRGSRAWTCCRVSALHTSTCICMQSTARRGCPAALHAGGAAARHRKRRRRKGCASSLR